MPTIFKSLKIISARKMRIRVQSCLSITIRIQRLISRVKRFVQIVARTKMMAEGNRGKVGPVIPHCSTSVYGTMWLQLVRMQPQSTNKQ